MLHTVLLVVGILFLILVLANLRNIGWILLALAIGIGRCISNIGKVLWFLIRAPFMLAWWIIQVPFKIVPWDDIGYFYGSGDLSVRAAKVLMTVAALGSIVGAVVHHFVVK